MEGDVARAGFGYRFFEAYEMETEDGLSVCLMYGWMSGLGFCKVSKFCRGSIFLSTVSGI